MHEFKYVGMKKTRFLWVDDEIDLLKPYILFLEEKGYVVESVNNGHDAIDRCRQTHFDMIFLDEHMPGISGLETLTRINDFLPDTPVVMVTKSEDEGIMDKAIGKKIADYLIKPVNPNQILMTVKKHLDKNEIIREANTVNYRDEFGLLSTEINSCASPADWVSLYKKLAHWDVELSESQHPMKELLEMQYAEANNAFGKSLKQHYLSWLQATDNQMIMSHLVFSDIVFPLLDRGDKVFFILIDNFRFDQWLVIKDRVAQQFTYAEDAYFSILPTATHYARNALFAGLLPEEIAESYPQFWVEEGEEESKNQFEEELLAAQLKCSGRKEPFSYRKINNTQEAERLLNSFSVLEQKSLNVLVYNFIDMLSHARTDSTMIRELAPTEAAYRSLTRSWFLHSPLLGLLQKIAEKGYRAVITTDHGTIRVKNALKIVSDKSTNTNLRYKLGKNMEYDAKKVFEITQPAQYGLPSPNLSSRYVFATSNDFFVYPTNHNQYVSYYENTFQHGGISMEEMIVPLITLQAK